MTTSHTMLRAAAMALAAGLTLSTASAVELKVVPKAGERDVNVLLSDVGLQESSKPVTEIVKNWKKPQTIVVQIDNKPGRLEWLQEVAPGVKLVPVSNPQNDPKKIAEVAKAASKADALLNVCNEAVLKDAKSVRWIQLMHVGVENCVPALKGRDILLTNLQRVYSPVLSDHTIALMLALTRGLDLQIASQIQGKRERPPAARIWELRGRTMLVVGLGGIGTQVARKASAFGMRVIAVRNSKRDKPDFVEYVGTPDELPALIGQADVVVDALPLTPETKGVFNKAMFEKMRKDVYFINVGRGGTVVTEDIIEALNSGRILGAGLDVTDPEPLPPGHPLWTAKNVILTHHSAGMGVGTGPNSEEGWQVLRENLRRYVAGDKVYAIVELDRAY